MFGKATILRRPRAIENSKATLAAVSEQCQNPIRLERLELPIERRQPPQVVEIRHFRLEQMECLEPGHVLRNQQVAGSIPAGGSKLFKIKHLYIQVEVRRTADCGNLRAESLVRNLPPRTSLPQELLS